MEKLSTAYLLLGFSPCLYIVGSCPPPPCFKLRYNCLCGNLQVDLHLGSHLFLSHFSSHIFLFRYWIYGIETFLLCIYSFGAVLIPWCPVTAWHVLANQTFGGCLIESLMGRVCKYGWSVHVKEWAAEEGKSPGTTIFSSSRCRRW